ncbi:MAG: DNA mismatch repair endonuclease MutL [Bacillota bacterium]
MPHRPIAVLDPHVANRIAAGEVIERPASAVKELVENSLDAGARRVEVEIRGGGKEYIRVTDDGHGIPRAEVPLAFERHATSKIAKAEDLFAVATLGFRGEALPSIAAVAEVEMRTRTPDQLEGTRYVIVAGVPKESGPVGTPVGTTVIVRRLFFNTPARYKFLRTDTTEKRYVADVVARLAMARPDVAFRLLADGRELLATPGDGRLASAVAAVYGHAVARDMVPIEFEADTITVQGLVGKPSLHHSTRERVAIFLNGRWIQSNAIARAIENGYDTLLPPRRFPVAVVHLTMDPRSVDVNVHPAKAEVRFRDDGAVFRTVLRAVRQGLLGANLVGGMPLAAAVPRPAAGPEEPRHSPRPEEERAHYPAEVAPLVAAARETPAPAAAGAAALAQHAREAGFASEEIPPGDTVPARAPADVDARQVLREMTVLGQLHRTYILGETPAGLWIVDQHVAHERILYERFLKEAASGQARVQQLLMPMTMTLSPVQAGLVELFQDKLQQLGFVLEPFGGRTYLIRGVPAAFAAHDAGQIQGVLEDVLAACEAEGRWQPHQVCAQLACRAAVKAGQVLSERQMKQLLEELSQADNPFACPHGRPIVIEVPRAEIARRFGRH